jgi:hypothetical protein
MANEQSAVSNQKVGTGLGPCPKCSAVCVVQLPWGRKRCNACAHQWPEVSAMQRGPNRRAVLNGSARYVPGRIIYFRTR